MNIQEVREKYPQYKDLSDEQLVKGLHGKFYSDMPYDQFAAKVGLGAEAPKAEAQKPETKPLPANAGLANFIASTAGLPVDAVENVLNLAKAGVGTVATAAGRPDLAPELTSGSFGGSESIRRGLRATGVPGLSPDNPNPQSEGDTAQYNFVSRGGMLPGGVLPAAGSLVAEAVGGPEWAGVGALTPTAVGRGVDAARNAMAARIAPQVQAHREIGSQPSVGQATKLNFVQGMENLLSKFPGGQGVFRKFVENQQNQIAQNTATGRTAEQAGRAITKGVTGEGGFIERTKAQWLKLDDAVAQKIPQGTSVGISNTVQALDDLTKPAYGAEKTTAALVNPKLAELRQNLAVDIEKNNGLLPFPALRAVRTQIGSMLDDSLVSGVPNGQLKKVYGALSKDIETAATQLGAGQEFARQSAYYKARMERIDGVLNKVLGKNKTDAEVFNAFNPKGPDESSIVRSVMRSLNPEDKKIVSEAVVQRLGRAAAGKQDATGSVFSTETFLTNWNKMGPGAKAQLFPDVLQRRNLDALANVADDLRAGAKVFANPSGTAGATAPYGMGYLAASGAVDLATGNIPMAVGKFATAGGLIGGSYVGAKMLTNPKVVDWLAKSAKATSQEQQVAQIGRLAVIYSQTKDEALRGELSQFINSVPTGK